MKTIISGTSNGATAYLVEAANVADRTVSGKYRMSKTSKDNAAIFSSDKEAKKIMRSLVNKNRNGRYNLKTVNVS